MKKKCLPEEGLLEKIPATFSFIFLGTATAFYLFFGIVLSLVELLSPISAPDATGQIITASSKANSLLFLEFIVPTLIILLALVFIWVKRSPKSVYWKSVFALFSVFVSLLAILYFFLAGFLIWD
ncbi:MAG: hypothetical protein WC602_03395 [archaeon]